MAGMFSLEQIISGLKGSEKVKQMMPTSGCQIFIWQVADC